MQQRLAGYETRLTRTVALSTALTLAFVAAGLTIEATLQDGMQALDLLRGLLMFVTTGWLAWGALLAIIGLAPCRAPTPPPMTRNRAAASCSCRSATKTR